MGDGEGCNGLEVMSIYLKSKRGELKDGKVKSGKELRQKDFDFLALLPNPTEPAKLPNRLLIGDWNLVNKDYRNKVLDAAGGEDAGAGAVHKEGPTALSPTTVKKRTVWQQQQNKFTREGDPTLAHKPPVECHHYFSCLLLCLQEALP
jgi:hypothetical protein